MSKTSLVMTVLGADRPGIVETLAKTVADHGGNWIESRMAHLAGQFAGIVRVEVETESATQLSDVLRRACAGSLDVIIHSNEVDSPRKVERIGIARLDLVGQDRPGILSEITQVLAAHHVNVEDLTTRCVIAPTTGQQLFQAEAELRMLSPKEEVQLRESLERIAGDLMVDISFDTAVDEAAG